MLTLPTEVLQYICDYTGEPVACRPAGTTSGIEPIGPEATLEFQYLALLAFSCSSRHLRRVALPYLFRRLRLRTVEEAVLVTNSSFLHHVRHITLPAVDIFTARRPAPRRLHALLANVTSIRIASTTPAFYYTGTTPLARLLHTAKALTTLELVCDPILESVDTMPILARLLPAFPESITSLKVTMPGGQPEYAGTEVLLKALEQPSRPFPNLNSICLSMHMPPVVTAMPEKLAIALARRSPSVRYVTFLAPGRNPQRGTPLWDLIGPEVGATGHYGGFREQVMSWEFERENVEEGEAKSSLDQRTELEYPAGSGGSYQGVTIRQ